MARPEKFTAEYFPFYTKDGRTLTILQHRFGLAGIGFFTNLMRILASTPHHYIHLGDEADKVYFAERIGCDETEVETYIETLLTTRKLHITAWKQHRILYCQDLVESLNILYEKRTNRPKTIGTIMLEVSGSETLPIGDIADTKTNVSGDIYAQTREEKSILKERKEDAPDEVVQAYRTEIEAQGCPALSWTDTHKQLAALRDIAERTRGLAPDSVLTDPVEFARGIMAVFKRRKAESKGDYWKRASPAPVVLQRRFDELVTGLSDEYKRMQEEQAGEDAIMRMYQR